MTKKRIQERRKRNQELAAMDAKRRCAYCRKALGPSWVTRFSTPEVRFCDDSCLADYEAFHADGNR